MEARLGHIEKELLLQLNKGNQQAFTEIYNRYWSRLYFLAHKHCKSADAAEEIVQEVFLNLWKKRESVTIDNLSAYLAAMTRYEVYRYTAKDQKYAGTGAFFLTDVLKADDNEEHLDQKILLEMIEKLSHRLPEKCRLVFVQNKLQDKPLELIARELDISSKTAEAHLTRALKAIRGTIRKSFSFFYNFFIFF